MTNQTLANKLEHLLSFALIAISITTSLLAINNVGLVGAESGSQQATYLQRPDAIGRPQLMVAIHCYSNGVKPATLYHNQYLEIETRKWRTDRDVNAFCTQDKKEVLKYCRKVYPNHDIRNIVESSRPYKIDNWCKLGSPKRRCRTRLTVRPYRCLEGTFQSDALLVPERCLFDHVHNKSICESPDHWNATASENCYARGMKPQSFAMLQPCGIDVFSGVEFVCCPTSDAKNKESSSTKATSTEGNSFAQAANGVGWPKDSKYDLDSEKANGIKNDDEVTKMKHHDQSDNDEQEDSDVDDEDDDEYGDDEDEYDDDSTSWNSDKASSTSSSTTTTTTTTTTERPVDHYLSHFDVAHEHDEFRRAELAVEGNYRDKITHVMREWSQLDSHIEELKKKDPQAAENLKKKMTHQFQKTIEALEEEGAAQRHQLASMHAERAMAIINRRKKAALDCLTQALDKIPIRTRQVERCIVKLLKALEKDRTHTLRQYKNLLNLNTREALHEKQMILDHLVTLNRAANQSITMLDRSPVLADELKNKIVTLWHKLRNIPLDEPISRESELKIMEKYEEEVAQRKIEREHQRMMDQENIQDPPQESSSETPVNDVKDTSKLVSNQEQQNTSVKSISPSPDVKELAPQTTVSSKLEQIDSTTSLRPHLLVQSTNGQTNYVPSSAQTIDGHNDMDNEIHYQIDSAKFAHLKADTSHHELSYSVGHELLEGQWKFGYPTFLFFACTIVVALALVGVRYYSRNSTRAYRRQGFAEVGGSCPEEKSVTNMQFNGYENPAYKFFEAEA